MEMMYKQVINSFYNDFVIYKLQKDNKLNLLISMDIENIKDYKLFFNSLLKKYREEKKVYEIEFKTVFNYDFLMSFLEKYRVKKLTEFDDSIFNSPYILFAFLKTSLIGLMHIHYEGAKLDIIEGPIEYIRVDGTMSYEEIEPYLNSYEFNRYVLQPRVFLDTTYRLFLEFSCFNIPEYLVLLQIIDTYVKDRIPKDYKKYCKELEDFTQYDYDLKYFLDKNLKIYSEFVKKEFKKDNYEYKPIGCVASKKIISFGFVVVSSDIDNILEYYCQNIINNVLQLLAHPAVDSRSPYRVYASVYSNRRKLMEEKYQKMGKVYTPPKIYRYWPWFIGQEKDEGRWVEM